jgi:tRNA threonylcarbamoyladenosine modification (KEOPS) complex  Pcc1 subunit
MTEPTPQPPVQPQDSAPYDPYLDAIRRQEMMLEEDDTVTELRLQVAFFGERLLGRVKTEVEVLEEEVVALAAIFNEYLDEVKLLDKQLSELTTSINKGKLDAARELDETLKREVQVVVDQLRLVQAADLESVDVLYQNLDALQDNYKVLQAQTETLKEIGIKTEQLEKNIPALQRGIEQFGKSIEARQLELLVGEQEEAEVIDYESIKGELNALIQSQSRAMINHLRQVQVNVNPKEIAALRRNQRSFESNYAEIIQQLQGLEQAGVTVDDLRDQLRPIESGLRQFERALESNQLLKFVERIYEEVEIATAQIAEAHKIANVEDLEVLEENVDILFDNCDQLADELDELGEQGHNIAPLLEHYDILRMNIEQFERVVQEAANRIGITTQGSLSSS